MGHSVANPRVCFTVFGICFIESVLPYLEFVLIIHKEMLFDSLSPEEIMNVGGIWVQPVNLPGRMGHSVAKRFATAATLLPKEPCCLQAQ